MEIPKEHRNGHFLQFLVRAPLSPIALVWRDHGWVAHRMPVGANPRRWPTYDPAERVTSSGIANRSPDPENFTWTTRRIIDP